jgi:LPXTG-motif cell wall-anchored protein
MRPPDGGPGDAGRLVGPVQRARISPGAELSGVQVELQPAPARRVAPVCRADLVPAIGVLCVVAVLGLPLGALWSWLAPPEYVARTAGAPTPDGVLPFVGQSEHRFDDTATFLLLGLAAGLLIGAALWLFRRRRGPLVLVAAVLGSVIGGLLAMRVGLWLVAADYPELASIGVPFPRAPVLESAWVVVGQPFGIAVAYSLATAWNGAEDLGTGSA